MNQTQNQKWYQGKKQICSLLLVLIFIISCNGQVKTNLPKENVSESKIIAVEQAKLIKTQGEVFGNVGCALQDKAGNIWFGTGGKGVYRYDGKFFTNFTTNDGLNDNNVNAIIEDKAGNVLFGTNKGICKYDLSTARRSDLLKAREKPITNFIENDVLSKIAISSLLEDSDGNLWFGTMNSGVYRYAPSTKLMAGQKSLTNFLNNDDYLFNLGVHHQAIIDIFQDKNGNIWFSSWNGGGVWRYNPSAARRSDSLKAGEKPFKNYLPSTDYYLQNEDGRSSAKKNLPTYLSNFTNSQSKDNISDDMIFSIAEDKAGNIWFATRRHGACRFDPSAKEKAFTSFGENEGFVSYGIYSILEDKNGHLWFTTEKNGVWSYNPSPNTGGQSFKNYTTKDGLINNSVFSVLEDKIGSLWFGTRGFGLSRYKSSAKLKMGEKAFTNFSE